MTGGETTAGAVVGDARRAMINNSARGFRRAKRASSQGVGRQSAPGRRLGFGHNGGGGRKKPTISTTQATRWRKQPVDRRSSSRPPQRIVRNLRRRARSRHLVEGPRACVDLIVVAAVGECAKLLLQRIRPADLKNAPRFPTILPKVKDFVGESPIVAHAYKNERDFLDYEFARAKAIQ